ncbi:hypothetical protein [Lelliottia amnigena]
MFKEVKTKQVTVKITPTMEDWLNSESLQRGITKAALVQLLINTAMITGK